MYANSRQAAEDCELFVFNGDIFDFKWSLHDGFEAAVHAAKEWIRELVTTHPDTQFVFLLGNHDCVAEYRDTLTELCEQFANLQWQAHWYRLGQKLFLHGDVCTGPDNAADLQAYREQCSRILQRSRFRHLCYWLFAQSGLPAVFLRFVNRETCAQRILAYLSNEMPSQISELTDIYFGHVHTPFADFRYNGILFHNTGSATKRMRLSVMRFNY